MIHSILAQLERIHSGVGLSWKELSIKELPYSSLMRWKKRLRSGEPLLQKPGPKKTQALPREFHKLFQTLPQGRSRTQGAGALYRQFSQSISRRQLQAMARQVRQHKLSSMKRIHWLKSNLVWAIDSTSYRGSKLIPIVDLASRYRLDALLAPAEEGHQIARFLEEAFKTHGAPLFFKRDNGSPFNCAQIDQVLSKYWVLPLNSPPAFPRYNGGMEKSIRDLKDALDKRILQNHEQVLSLGLQASLHSLNHTRRRSLANHTPCQRFHDPSRRLDLPLKARKVIFRLLSLRYLETIGLMDARTHHQLAKAWRLTVETWLRRQHWIAISNNQNQKMEGKVSTVFPKKWSHN